MYLPDTSLSFGIRSIYGSYIYIFLNLQLITSEVKGENEGQCNIIWSDPSVADADSMQKVISLNVRACIILRWGCD